MTASAKISVLARPLSGIDVSPRGEPSRYCRVGEVGHTANDMVVGRPRDGQGSFHPLTRAVQRMERRCSMDRTSQLNGWNVTVQWMDKHLPIWHSQAGKRAH